MASLVVADSFSVEGILFDAMHIALLGYTPVEIGADSIDVEAVLLGGSPEALLLGATFEATLEGKTDEAIVTGKTDEAVVTGGSVEAVLKK